MLYIVHVMDTSLETKSLEELIYIREQHINKTFFTLLRVFVYILAPALCAVYLAKTFENIADIIFVASALFLSTVLVFVTYKKIEKQFKSLDLLISAKKILKEKESEKTETETEVKN